MMYYVDEEESSPILRSVLSILLVLLILAGGALYGIPYYKEYKTKENLFDTLDLLAGCYAAGLGKEACLSYNQRMEASMEGMSQIDPVFPFGNLREQIDRGREYFDLSLYYNRAEVSEGVRDKETLLEFSEIPLQPASAQDRARARRLSRNGRPEIALSLLEPRTSFCAIRLAALTRGMSRVRNAKVFAGRIEGTLYSDPRPRQIGEWRGALAPEHPESFQSQALR